MSSPLRVQVAGVEHLGCQIQGGIRLLMIQNNTNSTRNSARKMCILLYLFTDPPVFGIPVAHVRGATPPCPGRAVVQVRQGLAGGLVESGREGLHTEQRRVRLRARSLSAPNRFHVPPPNVSFSFSEVAAAARSRESQHHEENRSTTKRIACSDAAVELS